jgi:hypothetical protein
MSSPTFRTITRDERKTHVASRSRGRAGTVLRHEMTVIASNVADVVTSAGGWLYDRRMAGWQVNVLLPDRAGERALRILGAEALDLSGDLQSITDEPDRAATVAVAADVYAADERVRRFVSASERSRAEVALWGDMTSLDQEVSAVSYRLSAAAKVFKSHALTAAGLPCEPVSPTEALFRCGVTAITPIAVRS